MRKAAFAAVMVLFLMGVAGPAGADSGSWEIDRAHSSIYFSVKHTFATVRGQFEDFSGTVRFDPENRDAGGAEFEVEVASINTYIPKRDQHLRSPDFFDADKFPVMSFASTGVRSLEEENRYILDGVLTIKGVSRETAIPFTYLGMRENPLEKGQMVAGFEAEFRINRLDYNVGSGRFAEMGVVGEAVDVLVTLELLQEK
jgi:polyisoprenoid-binding protein YceI